MALGLKEYKERKKQEEARREANSKPKVQRFNLLQDGDSAVVRFAQEMDADATNYDEKRGIGFVQIEHSNGDDPKNGWMNTANCTTSSQGACLPCEKVTDYEVPWDARKGWKQKEKFYINLIAGEPKEVDNPKRPGKTTWVATDIDKETGDGTVYLLSQSTANGIYDALGDYFLEEDISEGTITNKYFKITRKGSEYNNTSYNVTPLKEIPEGAKSLDEFELYDIEEDVTKEVPYAQQAAFYHGGASARAEEKKEDTPPFSTESTATGASDVW